MTHFYGPCFNSLETPVIRDADGLTCLTFYYNMHGENVGSLTVYTQVLDRYDDRISYPEYSIEREQGTQWLLFRKTIPMHGRNKRVGITYCKPVDVLRLLHVYIC